MTQRRRLGDDTRALWLMVALLLAVSAPGMSRLDATMLWWDEFLTVQTVGGAHFAPKTPAEVWTDIAQRNPYQTPGYFVALNGWGTLAGWSAFALRLFSLLTGLVAVAFVYRAGRDRVGVTAGLAAAVALGVSALFIRYLYEARPYSLTLLAAAAALWGYERVRRGGDWRTAAIFTLAVAGLVYTHYTAGVLALALALVHVGGAVFGGRRDMGGWRVLALMALAGVLFAPWLGVMLSGIAAVADSDARRFLSLDALAGKLVYGFSNGLPVLSAAVGVWLVVVWVRRRAGDRVRRAAGFYTRTGVLFLVGALALNAAVPFITHVRYLLPLLPVWALLLGVVVGDLAAHERVPGRTAAALLVTVWIGAGAAGVFAPTFLDTLMYDARHVTFFRPRLPLHVALRHIDAHAQRDDALVFAAPLHGWALAGTFDLYARQVPMRAVMTDQLAPDADAAYAAALRAWLGTAERVWLLVETTVPDDARLAAAWAVLGEQGYSACAAATAWDGLTLDLYTRSPLCCAPPGTPPVARFGGVTLGAVEREGDVMRFAWLRETDVPVGRYSVAVHLLDGAGRLAAQTDYPLPDEAFACAAARLPLDGLESGRYEVMTTVYDWQTGARLDAAYVPLETVTIP